MTDIEQIERDREAGTPGPWKWSTSNSWNRLSTTGRDGKDGGVLCPFKNRSDGHPDICVSASDMRRIARVPDLEDAVIALTAERDALRNALRNIISIEEKTELLKEASDGTPEQKENRDMDDPGSREFLEARLPIMSDVAKTGHAGAFETQRVLLALALAGYALPVKQKDTE